ncbi:MAG: hypothetical protein ACM3S5_18155 [Rhodospirillales bacterium]
MAEEMIKRSVEPETGDEDEILRQYYEHRFDYHAYIQRRLRAELEPRRAVAGQA